MKRLCMLPPATLLCTAAFAGGIAVRVNKDAVAVRPADAQGTVAIAGPPGCVTGMAPLQVIAHNKKTRMTAAGAVAPDGSFVVQIPAGPKDSVKLTFIGADRKKKDVKVKVPEVIFSMPPQPIRQDAVTETVTAPAGGQETGEPPPVTDTQIITGEKNLEASGMIE